MELINQDDNIFGCYMSDPPVKWDDSEDIKLLAAQKGDIFREYLWGEEGIDSVLKEPINIEYGNDVRLILFQFMLEPFSSHLDSLSELEGYRKKEKSIGVNIIITKENFFDKSHDDRVKFIQSSIMNCLVELEKKFANKLDTRFDLLIRELNKLFDLEIQV